MVSLVLFLFIYILLLVMLYLLNPVLVSCALFIEPCLPLSLVRHWYILLHSFTIILSLAHLDFGLLAVCLVEARKILEPHVLVFVPGSFSVGLAPVGLALVPRVLPPRFLVLVSLVLPVVCFLSVVAWVESFGVHFLRHLSRQVVVFLLLHLQVIAGLHLLLVVCLVDVLFRLFLVNNTFLFLIC